MINQYSQKYVTGSYYSSYIPLFMTPPFTDTKSIPYSSGSFNVSSGSIDITFTDANNSITVGITCPICNKFQPGFSNFSWNMCRDCFEILKEIVSERKILNKLPF